jgi:putative acetyltransferase
MPEPPPDILIRALEPADAADVAEVFNQPRAVWGTMQVPFLSRHAREQRSSEIDRNSAQLVAVVGGKAIAQAGLKREPYHRRNHVAGLGMAVHDAYAGRGVGTALMTALVDLADRWWNIKRLELDVYTDNARAIALYERFGFEREGVRRAFAWRDGQYADVLSMARLRL